MNNKVTDSVIYVGANDHDIDLFESQYPVPNGMSYNSYIILDDKTAVFDTIDIAKTDEWMSNIEHTLGERKPDFLIIQHMEPDHAAAISVFMQRYSDTTVVGNTRTFSMICQFFPDLNISNRMEVKDGDTLCLGRHNLKFIFTPMVHWPEVMMTYDTYEKILFSADAFGKFGALDAPDNWSDEARRYYFGIVAKYGVQVQNVLKKASALDISIICPLHGPFLTENIIDYVKLYDTWSSYKPECSGVCIFYASVYGSTADAAKLLYNDLSEKGIKDICIHDLTRCDISEAIADAFKYETLVLASVTYNGTIFPVMQFFLSQLADKNFQGRTIALIENGSWAPLANKVMRGMLEKCKNITFAEKEVTITSALNNDSRTQIKLLADEISHMKNQLI